MSNTKTPQTPSNCLGFTQLPKKQQTLFEQLLEKAQSWEFLVDKPEENPLNSLVALWHKSRETALSLRLSHQHPLQSLSNPQITQLNSLFNQRSLGAPLSHLLERQHFMGLELISSTDALIPRLETEMLAEVCIELISQLPSEHEPIIIDQFTGSGNLPLSFANLFPTARILGGDISEKCIELSQKNAEFCHLKQVEFRVSDMFAAFETPEFLGKVDLISAAPPYISSKKVPEMHNEISQHEPKLAFDAGPFGIAFFVRLIQESPKFLKSGGWLAMEVGLGQGPSTLKLLEKSGFYSETKIKNDAQGNVRVVAGRKK